MTSPRAARNTAEATRPAGEAHGAVRAAAGMRLGVAPDLVVEELDEEVVVWEPASQQLHRLDGPASAVLHSLTAPQTLEQVAVALAEAYGAAVERILADVLPLASTLLAAGLLVPAEDLRT